MTTLTDILKFMQTVTNVVDEEIEHGSLWFTSKEVQDRDIEIFINADGTITEVVDYDSTYTYANFNELKQMFA